jgi:hypothetical protein
LKLKTVAQNRARRRIMSRYLISKEKNYNLCRRSRKWACHAVDVLSSKKIQTPSNRRRCYEIQMKYFIRQTSGGFDKFSLTNFLYVSAIAEQFVECPSGEILDFTIYRSHCCEHTEKVDESKSQQSSLETALDVSNCGRLRGKKRL